MQPLVVAIRIPMLLVSFNVEREMKALVASEVVIFAHSMEPHHLVAMLTLVLVAFVWTF